MHLCVLRATALDETGAPVRGLVVEDCGGVSNNTIALCLAWRKAANQRMLDRQAGISQAGQRPKFLYYVAEVPPVIARTDRPKEMA